MPGIKKRYVVNFPAHLADCEFNYRRLQRLMPGWRDQPKTPLRSQAAPSVSSGCANGDNLDKKSLSEDWDQKGEWRYIVGQNKHSEIALLLHVTESAKYTTTVHVAVHSDLQNQMSWSKYLQYSAKNKQPIGVKPQISMADIQGSVTMLLDRFKSYSFEVRLYHDASVAEVISWEGNRRFKARHDYPNPRMYHSDEKAQLNRFLGELLERCLTQGRILDDVKITS